MALSLYAAKCQVPKLEIDEDEAILPMHRLRVFSPETGYYNNSRDDDPAPSVNEYQSRNREIVSEIAPPQKTLPVTLKLFLG